MVIKTPHIKQILKNPEKAAALANLIYITDNKLTIERHKHGRGFYYIQQGKKVKDSVSLRRFKNLVIPPAWNEVRITHLENGHLQVVGRDEKRRKQYRYHPHWSQIRNKTKFLKMASFGKALPAMRATVAKDLRLRLMTKRKCLALIVSLMEETHIRIGNDYYAKRNKTYGLSTLRTRHLDIYKNKLKFEFVGKKGKKHNITLRNKKLQKLVLECKEIPGWELFQYYDEDGKHHTIDSGMVNDYIQEISGDLFSAKDFRTWAGSKVFFETLYDLTPPTSEKETQKNIITAFDATARSLGNTRTVCKKYYVHPAIPAAYEQNGLIDYFSQMDNAPNSQEGRPSSEIVLMDLYSAYKPVLI